jgi:MinD-like ATPase involved in chromosome partitioning or flagellar assembly
VADDDLIQKIKQMSEYLDEEAIAAALRIPEQVVHDALAGRVSMSSSETEKQSVLEVQTNPVYRQRIISVWRGRGGVGCTSIALHLAYVLEQMMSVLLVDLNAMAAGSDVGYYLRLSEYPNIETISKQKTLSSAVIQADTGLWVLLPPLANDIEKGTVKHLAIEARNDFDAIIFDLPNTDVDCVAEAVSCSHVLVMVTNGQPQEMKRVLARKIETQNQSQRETILVANGCSCDGETRRMYDKVVEIPEDRDLPAKMERGMFYKKGSPLTIGTEKVRDLLYGMRSQKESRFRMVARLLRG